MRTQLSNGDIWHSWEERLAPDAWLFVCHRPEGFKWDARAKDDFINWAHVYVFTKQLHDINGRKTLYHCPLREEDPMLLKCVELEVRKQFTDTL
jgi:hypothetical protein